MLTGVWNDQAGLVVGFIKSDLRSLRDASVSWPRAADQS